MKYLLSLLLVAVTASALPSHIHGFEGNAAVVAAKDEAHYNPKDAYAVYKAVQQVADADPKDDSFKKAADAASKSALDKPGDAALAAAAAANATDPTNVAFAARLAALKNSNDAPGVTTAAKTASDAADKAHTDDPTDAKKAAKEKANAAHDAASDAALTTADAKAKAAEAAYNPAVTAARIALANGGTNDGTAHAVATAARAAADEDPTNLVAQSAADAAEFSERFTGTGAEALGAAQKVAAAATNPFG